MSILDLMLLLSMKFRINFSKSFNSYGQYLFCSTWWEESNEGIWCKICSQEHLKNTWNHRFSDFRISDPANTHSLFREGAFWRVENPIILFIRVLAFIKNMKSIFYKHRSPGGDPQPNQISRNRQMGQLCVLHSLAYDS